MIRTNKLDDDGDRSGAGPPGGGPGCNLLDDDFDPPVAGLAHVVVG